MYVEGAMTQCLPSPATPPSHFAAPLALAARSCVVEVHEILERLDEAGAFLRKGRPAFSGSFLRGLQLRRCHLRGGSQFRIATVVADTRARTRLQPLPH